MAEIKRLTKTLMAEVAERSRQNPRRRQNHNFHDHAERVQRFLNVMQPGTYVRPHRHLRGAEVNGFEFFLVLQGKLGLLVMDEQGNVRDRALLTATGDLRGIELPEGTIHTLVVLAPDTVLLELKEGPYVPATDKDFLPQFPAEGTEAAQEWVATWEKCFESVPA